MPRRRAIARKRTWVGCINYRAEEDRRKLRTCISSDRTEGAPIFCNYYIYIFFLLYQLDANLVRRKRLPGRLLVPVAPQTLSLPHDLDVFQDERKREKLGTKERTLHRARKVDERAPLCALRFDGHRGWGLTAAPRLDSETRGFRHSGNIQRPPRANPGNHFRDTKGAQKR